MKPTKSKPRKAKPSPRQPGKGAKLPRIMWADYDPSYPKDVALQIHHSRSEAKGTRPDLTPFPVLVLDLSPGARNSRRWLVEQTYLRCHDAEITDPWEIADLVLRALGDTPAGEGRGK